MAAGRVVFDQVNLVVSDMAASVAFYERLGVVVAPTEPQWAHQHRNVVTDDGLALDLDSSAFAAQWNQGWPPGRVGPVLGFRLASREDVDRVHDDLVAAGYASEQVPYDAFWGARYAVVADPDGNSVGLMSPVDPARRAAAD